MPTPTIGSYPTPVVPIAGLSEPSSALWVKRDDLTHHVYGGNKVRKLEGLLAEATALKAKRLVTLGSVGSHHVLATAYFGRQLGLEVEAVLVPQPRTAHVVSVLRASLGQGLKAIPVRSWAGAPAAVLARVARGAHYLPLGGSNAVGTQGYVDAGRELASQVGEGLLPEPEVCVVALGSGGTAAGLSVGFAEAGLRTRVVGVCVSSPAWALRALAGHLARACAPRALSERPRLSADEKYLGRGYGYSTPEGDEATALAQLHAGLALDPTYTAKAFACALSHVRSGRSGTVVYWHTLSSAPLAPLLASELAPAEEDLPRELLALVISPNER